MSYDFWLITKEDLARPDSYYKNSSRMHKAIIYAYRTAMITLNGLNYYWFSQMVLIGLGLGGKKERRKRKTA